MYQQPQSHSAFAFNQSQPFNQYKPMPAPQFAPQGHNMQMLGESSQTFTLPQSDTSSIKPTAGDSTHLLPPQTPYTPAAAPPSVAAIDPNMPQPQLQYIIYFFALIGHYLS